MDINSTAKNKEGVTSQREQEKVGGEERREGIFRIVIGAREVISDLKSSRCGPAPAKEKRRLGRWRGTNRKGGGIISLLHI